MANRTVNIALTTTWALLGTGSNAVLVSLESDPGYAEIAVADAIGDLSAADNLKMHALNHHKSIASFYNLGAIGVYGRKRISSQTVVVAVTSY